MSKSSCFLVQPAFEVGSQPPEGYLARIEWAAVQDKGGLRQHRCQECSKFRFPQEVCCSEETR